MIDVNAWMGAALSPVKLPACEEPMRVPCPGTYITWAAGSVRTSWASGRVIAYVQAVQCMVWATDTADSADVAATVCDALRAAGARAVTRLSIEFVPDVNRRCASISLIIREDV